MEEESSSPLASTLLFHCSPLPSRQLTQLLIPRFALLLPCCSCIYLPASSPWVRRRRSISNGPGYSCGWIGGSPSWSWVMAASCKQDFDAHISCCCIRKLLCASLVLNCICRGQN
ncbi:hypothetical protein BS78_10G229400 [Paspalum vaginatum]|nr:hypothetical protein BS78_10G229400 [Paspalum vaginatum]